MCDDVPYRARLLQERIAWLRYPARLFAMSRRVERMLFRRAEGQVLVFTVGAAPVGFYLPQVRAALDPDPDIDVELDPAVLRHTDCVFLVPSKVRAYAELLPERMRRRLPEPAPALALLQLVWGSQGVRVVDLTPPLRRAARELVPRGHHIYWRDDTHWNG